MTIDHDRLEALARMLCESSIEDKGRYDRKGCKRAYWRKLAAVEISQSHAVSLADAVMGIFGFKRVGQ